MFSHPGWYMGVQDVLYTSHVNHRNSSNLNSHSRKMTEEEKVFRDFRIHFFIYYHYYFNRN